MTAIDTPLPPAVTPTPMGLEFRDDLDFEEWAAIGERFGTAVENLAWYLGDWLNYGKRHFEKRIPSERYDAAVAATGMARGTLRVYASVASLSRLNERDPRLSFSHYQELASVPEENRQEWEKLLLSHDDIPSKNRLRDSIRLTKGEKPRIVADEEIRSQPDKSGIDNYGFHIVRLTTILRDMIPKADEEQRAVIREDLSELIKLMRTA